MLDSDDAALTPGVFDSDDDWCVFDSDDAWCVFDSDDAWCGRQRLAPMAPDSAQPGAHATLPSLEEQSF